MEQFFAPCPRGLEGILADEVTALGAKDVNPTQGGVGFTGPFSLCYRINLESRIASRVLWRISETSYRSEADIYGAAQALPWPQWFSAQRTIKVSVSGQRSPLKSLDFVTLRVKDAVCDRFRAVTGRRPSVETSRPDIRIEVFLDQQSCLIYLDTSGEALFKRGLRRAAVEAPLRENLAAGLLTLAGWTPEQVLLDPMCGGGTILLEAAQLARRMPPGLGRRFAFEHFSGFDRQTWDGLCAEARARRCSTAPLMIYGSDRDSRALQAARTNLEGAGLADSVTLSQADILDIAPPAEAGVLIMNPPYGARLGEQDALVEFYPRLGDMLKQRFPGWRAYIFTADLRLPKLIGLSPSHKTPLFNGPLECRFYEFKLVRGPARHLQRSR